MTTQSLETQTKVWSKLHELSWPQPPGHIPPPTGAARVGECWPGAGAGSAIALMSFSMKWARTRPHGSRTAEPMAYFGALVVMVVRKAVSQSARPGVSSPEGRGESGGGRRWSKRGPSLSRNMKRSGTVGWTARLEADTPFLDLIQQSSWRIPFQQRFGLRFEIQILTGLNLNRSCKCPAGKQIKKK